VKVSRRWLGQELPPQCARPKTLYPLELTIEIRIVAKSNAKANIQNAIVGIDQHLRGSAHAEFVEVCRHCAPGCPFEESAQ
jgi:predicted molibdopterin-dependent oxidoreductase YjgC